MMPQKSACKIKQATKRWSFQKEAFRARSDRPVAENVAPAYKIKLFGEAIGQVDVPGR